MQKYNGPELGYHGNEEDLIPQGPTKRKYIRKDKVEVIPSPEDPYKELFNKKEEEEPVIEESGRDVSYEDTSPTSRVWDTSIQDFVDQKFLDVENPEDKDGKIDLLMDKLTDSYEHTGYPDHTFEETNEPMESKNDPVVAKKHESMNQDYKRLRYPGDGSIIWSNNKSPKDNLKTRPDKKKQRSFRQIIRNILHWG